MLVFSQLRTVKFKLNQLMRSWRIRLAVGLLTAQRSTATYMLDLSSTDSIRAVAKSVTEDMMSFYTGHQPGEIPGLLPAPYYWWEAGALMGALIDYWYYTGDTQWNDIVEEGLLFQAGPNNDYMPPNQTMTEGNDDQGFWGMTVLSAAEYNFQNPAPGKPQWLALAQAVFNTQAARWEDKDCGGGLRWQIFTWNNGYNYKNSISQACFFNIAARLARYTGNDSYADWAERTWDWMVATELLNLTTYYIYDGMHTANCSSLVPYQWTYNTGAFLLGAAALYNYSIGTAKEEMWRERVDGLLNGTLVFFTGDNRDIMTEVACEPIDLCDLDQQSFKAYLSRWMAAAVKWAPWAYDRVMPLLRASAIAAASTCTGGGNGRMCGLKWTEHGKWDGTTGVGQQMAAMEVVLANMIQHTVSPVTSASGGTSVGNPAAGGGDVGREEQPHAPISTADKSGAYVLTVLAIMGLIIGCVHVVADETKPSLSTEKFAKLRSFAATTSGTASRTKVKLPSQSTSEEKGRNVVGSNSVGTLQDVAGPKTGIVVHSCVRVTEAMPGPALRPLRVSRPREPWLEGPRRSVYPRQWSTEPSNGDGSGRQHTYPGVLSGRIVMKRDTLRRVR